MARTALTAQRIPSSGLEVAASAANVDGHSISLGDGMILYVLNGSGGSITVTIPTPQTVDGLAVADRTVVVEAGEFRLVALRGNSVYRQADGTAWVDFSAVTSVSAALLQV